MILIKKGDLQFLIDLQTKLKYQEEHDNDYQAAPRFWVVAENKREYGIDPDYGDGEVVCCVDGGTWDTPEDFIDYLVDNEYISRDDIETNNEYDFKEIFDILDSSNFYTCGYRDNYDVIAPNTMFLTKDSAKKHIELNHYHYSQPHTYAMTAWRSPEVERLFKILEETDWSEFVKEGNGNE